MTNEILTVLGLGLILGLKHATDADHVVAVTTIVTQERSLLRSCWIGAFWGLGHSLSLMVAGIAVIGLRVQIPLWLSERLELGVALMLIVLGALSLRRVTLHRHAHVHTPGQAAHGHWHIHAAGDFAHTDWSHFGLRPLLVGIVHGAAGSAVLMLLVLSTIPSPAVGFLYILVFGLGTVISMLIISFLLSLPLHWAGSKMSASYRPIQIAAGLFSCIFGFYYGAHIWMNLQ